MSQSTSQSSTITSIIQQIETNMLQAKYETQEPAEEMVRYHKKWSHEEKQILAHLVRQYGSDFTYFKRFLPFKTRKQIQRGYECHAIKELRLRKIIQRRERKDRFDVDVLGDDLHMYQKIQN